MFGMTSKNNREMRRNREADIMIAETSQKVMIAQHQNACRSCVGGLAKMTKKHYFLAARRCQEIGGSRFPPSIRGTCEMICVLCPDGFFLRGTRGNPGAFNI